MKFSILSVQFVDDEPGMSIGSRSDCPQASQACCDTPAQFGKHIPRLSFRFSWRGGGWGKNLRLEIKILLGSSSE